MLPDYARSGAGRQLTTEDYARAEKFMGYNTNSLVYHGVARPTWMSDGRFWYRDNGPEGITFTVVDPGKGTKTPAFDQAKLAAALTSATDGKMKADAWHLVISEIEFSDGDKTVVVGNGSRKFRCNLSGAGVCTELIAPGGEQTANKTFTEFFRRIRRRKLSFVTGISGCGMWLRVRRRS